MYSKIKPLILAVITGIMTLNLIGVSAITTIYNIPADTFNISMGRIARPFAESNLAQYVAEFVGPNSTLIGQQINYMEVAFVKEGALQGRVIAGVFNAQGQTVADFGDFQVSSLPSNGVTTFIKFTSASPHTIQQGDYIGVRYSHPDNNDRAFVGTFTSVFVRFDGNNTKGVFSPSGNTWMDNTGLSEPYLIDDPNSSNGTRVVRDIQDMAMRFGLE